MNKVTQRESVAVIPLKLEGCYCDYRFRTNLQLDRSRRPSVFSLALGIDAIYSTKNCTREIYRSRKGQENVSKHGTFSIDVKWFRDFEQLTIVVCGQRFKTEMLFLQFSFIRSLNISVTFIKI